MVMIGITFQKSTDGVIGDIVLVVQCISGAVVLVVPWC